MSQIQIYARIRPSSDPFGGIKVCSEDQSIGVHIGHQDDVMKRPESRYARAPPSSYNFKFSRVFDQQATQEEVFNQVAVHMIDSFLSGYNGTIFAYGQTSSGKTHTIEGSSRRFSDRGLIPRTISMVFREVERRCGQGQEVTVHVSYMEIYQDMGYDLLNAGTRPGALMVTLPKVHITEGTGHEVKVRNLSQHLAASEEVALSLLFQGSTCRKVAETSMNQCSSRSHTVFTLYLTSKSSCKGIITKSKLNLVDLAGSERVAKTRADGRVLQEAKHINLSLHHLEHVIVTLQQLSRQNSTPYYTRTGSRSRNSPAPYSTSPVKASVSQSLSEERFRVGAGSSPSRTPSGGEGRGHVPYRNSMLTMVLKDSLGGNCVTAMIATISAEEANVWESVSTCRFSQRVACISNIAKCNEELDNRVVIKKLKQRISELEAQVKAAANSGTQAVASSGEPSSVSMDFTLSPTDQRLCHKILHQFFHGKIENPVLAGIDSAGKFHECMQVMKKIVLHALELKEQQQQQKQQQQQRQQNKTECGRTSNTPSHKEISARESTISPQTSFEQTPNVTSHLHNMDDHVPVRPIPSLEPRRPQHRGNKPLPLRKVAHSHNGCGTSSSVSLSPLSRLSSGFGSLQDEGSVPTLDWSEGGGVPLSPITGIQEMRQGEMRRAREAQETVRRRLQDEGSVPTLDWSEGGGVSLSPATGAQSVNEGETRGTFIGKQDTGTFAEGQSSPLQAWTSPAVRSPALTTPPRASVASSAEGKAVQTLFGKRQELKQAKLAEQQLEKNVDLLNLQVLEEQLINELSDIKEKVALQYLRVREAEKASNPMVVASEKIAEHQLCSKQSKLYQKWLDVQDWIKEAAARDVDTFTGSTTTSSTPPSSLSPAARLLTDPRVTQSQEQRAHRGTKKDVKKQQALMDEELEKVRILQMEKELELKEAATLRKIQALKQQFTKHGAEMLTGGDTSLSTYPTSPRAEGQRSGPLRISAPVTRELKAKVDKSNPWGVSKSAGEHLMASSNGEWRAVPSTATSKTLDSEIAPKSEMVSVHGAAQNKRYPSPQLHSGRGHNSHLVGDMTSRKEAVTDRWQSGYRERDKNEEGMVDGESRGASRNLAVSVQSTNHIPSTTSGPTSTRMGDDNTAFIFPSKEDTHSHTQGHGGVHHDVPNSPPKYYSASVPATSKNYMPSPTTSTHHQTPSGHVTSPSDHMTSPSSCGGHMTSPSSYGGHMTSPATPSRREKLTLPEEVKETAYMSAVQKQKVRVSKIRRCIVAATVIQRAWRQHRLQTVH